MERVHNAVTRFLGGYACSQAILSQYCERFNLDVETALKLSAGFAGGMRLGKTCGVVTGAYMVLGLKFCAENCEKPEGRKNVYKAVATFTDRFEKKHGSACCEDLLGCNISTAAGMRKAKEEKLFKTKCPEFVQSAAELLEILLEEN